MTLLPDIQLTFRPGIIELGWGHPDLALLPGAALAQAVTPALQHDSAALAYGAEQGPGRLITQLCTRFEQMEGITPLPEHLCITGGISQALDMLCTLLTRPGDVVLIESPSYHLVPRIFRDHGLTLAPVPCDEQGIRLDLLETLHKTLTLQGRQPRLLYTVPTFNNPTGISLVSERRSALVSFAQHTGLTVLEDDAYRELWFDAPPPTPLYNLTPAGPVIRLGSFSKVLAPGLRLGWMLAAPEVIHGCAGSGLLDSGGGINHFTAHVVAAFLAAGLLEPHIATLRNNYRRRRDLLLGALARYLPDTCTWIPPLGGFFVWLRLPPAVHSAALLPQAEAAGVAYLPGVSCYTGGGGETHLRLAFSLLSPDDLEEGVRRLATVLTHTRPGG